MIAGICVATGCQLATRNLKDFDDANLSLIDPWSYR